MPKMKDSGIGWIDIIPADWETNKIKYLFDGRKGLPITKDNLIEKGLPVISYGQIHSKVNSGVNIKPELIRFVDFSYQKFYPQCEVQKNDFVFADTSEDYEGCGNCVYKRDTDVLFAGYHSIILHSKYNQDNRYFAYLFKTDCWRKQIREIASGVKVFSITQKNLINASVIVPPMSEQQRIANYLDEKCNEIDKLCTVIEKEIETLDEYKKTVITEAVTKGLSSSVEMKDSGIEWIERIPKHWKIIRIKHICKKITDGSHFSPAIVDSGKKYITATNVNNDIIDVQGAKEISIDDYNILVKNGCRPNLGDVLLTKDGSVGRTAVVIKENDYVVLSSIGILTPSKETDST